MQVRYCNSIVVKFDEKDTVGFILALLCEAESLGWYSKIGLLDGSIHINKDCDGLVVPLAKFSDKEEEIDIEALKIKVKYDISLNNYKKSQRKERPNVG